MDAATENVNTSDVPNEALAYMRIAECKNDKQYWGIKFTLDKPEAVMLGWQADLQNSSAQQEFRVQSVKLVTYTAIEDDIEAVKQQATDTHIIYTLQGVRVASPINALPQGLYIVDGKKLLIP